MGMRRKVPATLVAACLLVATLAAAATPEEIRERVGVYIWGQVPDLSAAVEDARSLGARRVVRAFIGPWSDTPPYHDDTRPLALKLRDPGYQKLIREYAVIMFTAYDSYSYEREYGEADSGAELQARGRRVKSPLRPNPGKIERPSLGVVQRLGRLPSRQAAAYLDHVREEFSDFAFSLARYNRTFILSNWEAEHDVPEVRRWPVFQRYLQARLDGIAQGKARAARAHLPGRIYTAFEFTVVPGFLGRESGFERIGLRLRGVDYWSYSGWWSIGSAYDARLMGESFREAIRRIRARAGAGQQMIIGEFGEYWNLHPNAERLRAIVDVSIEEGVPYLFNWTLYDQPGEKDERGGDASRFGKFTQQRELTPQGRAMREWFGRDSGRR